jgi:hypothetical protein
VGEQLCGGGLMAAEDYSDYDDPFEDSRDPYLRTQRSCLKPIDGVLNHGAPWTDALERKLTKLWKSGMPLKEVCRVMGRTEVAISARLHKLGINPYEARSAVAIVMQPPKPKPQGTKMNAQLLIALLQTNYTTVECTFDKNGQRYTYKAPLSMGLEAGSLAVVPARDKFQVVTVVEVHDSPRIDVSKPFEYKWVGQKVDLSAYHDQTKREQEAIEQIAVAERRKAQEEALAQLVGVEGREAFMALVNPK